MSPDEFRDRAKQLKSLAARATNVEMRTAYLDLADLAEGLANQAEKLAEQNRLITGDAPIRRKCPECGHNAFKTIDGSVDGAQCLSCGKVFSMRGGNRQESQ